MAKPRAKPVSRRRPVLVDAGSGPAPSSRLPEFFRKWRQIRVDVDPEMQPDLVTSITDLSGIRGGTADAVWSAHCVEHLFAHEVPLALAEFRRVLRKTGFACIVVPDVQAVAEWVATDRLHEPIYESAAGPVTAHDMIWGYGRAISAGSVAMAHHCGFTPTLLLESLTGAGFEEILLRRMGNLELVALAMPVASGDAKRRENLMAGLGFSI